MVELKCIECGDTTTGKKSDVDEFECNCGGELKVLDSKKREREKNNDKCPKCGKIINNDEDTYDCEVCGEEEICGDCTVNFDELIICKKCIDEVYPREIKTKIEYKYKEMPLPNMTTVDLFAKSKFD